MAENGNKFARISKNQHFIQIEVPVIYFEEDGVFFANVPVLDITGYGNTEKEASDSLDIMLDEFIAYTSKNNTLDAALKELGWTKKSGLPSLVDQIKGDDHLQNIINTHNIRTDKKHISLPTAFAC